MNENNERNNERINSILVAIKSCLIIVYLLILFFSGAQDILSLIFLLMCSSQIQVICFIQIVLKFVENEEIFNADMLVNNFIFFIMLVYSIYKIYCYL